MTGSTALVRDARRRIALAACVVLLFAGCAYSLGSGNTLNQSKVDKVEQGIQQIRQLNFLKPVPLVVKSRDEAEQLMEADLMRDYTDNQLHADGIAGALVGLFPPGMDLKGESLKLLRNQVAGFYDQRSKEMVRVSGATDLGFFMNATEFDAQRDGGGEMVLAHEFTHALQDQHFDLDRKLDEVKNNDDRAIALKCVAEGDATLAGYAYLAGRMDESVLSTLLSHLDEIAASFTFQAADIPEGVKEPMIFQYTYGVRFVAEAYRHGGWAAVDALYATPPLSSHQIIHSADYFDHRTPPFDVSVQGYGQALPGWKKVDDDTYGELLVRIILERNLGKTASEVALAQQWAGDQMIVLQSHEEISAIWMIAFADAVTAAKFATVYATALARIPANRHQVEARDRVVLVVVGAAALSMESLAPSVWSASRIDGHSAAAAASIAR